MIQALKDELQWAITEMKETRTLISQYNGLRTEYNEVKKELFTVKNELEEMKNQSQGRSQVWEGIRNWGGWLVALIALWLRYRGG